MTIKGHTFGAGAPVICVPVVERTAERIVESIQRMTSEKMDMIEWRMDWYEDVGNLRAVETLLGRIAPYIEETVFLCTFRSKKQGGEREISEEDYLALNQAAAKTGVPDLIDLEFYQVAEPKKEIAALKRAGAGVVCSNHNFIETPDRSKMERQLVEMICADADFAKLAVMPLAKRDVLRLMEAVLLVKEQYPDSHVIAMSMGADGVISRLLGEWFGSEVTFAAFEKASAPGQVGCQAAAEVLGMLEELIERNE